MKLTDKDLLEDAVQGAINIMEAYGIDMISASVPLSIIKGAPTIEAIPVAWLEEQAKDNYDYSGTLIRGLLSEWRKEHEVSE